MPVSGAQSRFPGDPVTALIALATSEEASLSDRNRAIWALGQLGSAEALPTLRPSGPDQRCDHETLSVSTRWIGHQGSARGKSQCRRLGLAARRTGDS